MRKEDKDKLMALVHNYSFQDLMSNLTQITKDRADDYSDDHLKGKAIRFSSIAEILDKTTYEISRIEKK